MKHYDLAVVEALGSTIVLSGSRARGRERCVSGIDYGALIATSEIQRAQFCKLTPGGPGRGIAG
jgi:hypothetical protein